MMIEVPLSQGLVALIDDGDAETVLARKWCAQRSPLTFYAVCHEKGGAKDKRAQIQMHRIIINAQPGQCVDHINHNGLDNRRENLRICTRAENSRNQNKRRQPTSSQFKGVSWHQETKKWRATIHANGRCCSLGLFASEIDAALAYDSAAKEMFGEFAATNF